MLLDGFEVIKFAKGDVNIVITNQYVRLSKAALVQIGEPDYVKVMINRAKKVVAFLAAKENDDNAIKLVQRKIISSLFITKLSQLIALNGKKVSVKGSYEYEGDDEGLFFDLTKAKEE